MILYTLVDAAKRRIAVQKAALPAEELRRQAEELCRGAALQQVTEPCCKEEQIRQNRELYGRKRYGRELPFEQALRSGGLRFICEIKKASPSRGVIAQDFPYLQIARDYETAGADCLSVLTEPDYFLGSDAYFREIRAVTGLPMLRKDFTIDPYMIYQAKVMGADAVLLICAVLSAEELNEYLSLCENLGLTALVETHDEAEVEKALRTGARVIGVNNRNLRNFEVDLSTSIRLRRFVPEDILFVAESGIRDAQDIAVLREAGVNGVLIGETLMRSPDKAAALAALRQTDKRRERN